MEFFEIKFDESFIGGIAKAPNRAKRLLPTIESASKKNYVPFSNGKPSPYEQLNQETDVSGGCGTNPNDYENYSSTPVMTQQTDMRDNEYLKTYKCFAWLL